MPELVLIPPAGECIDLNEALLHLRVTEDSQNALIAGMLSAACEAAQMEMRRQLLHARRRLYQDKFPMAGSGTPLPMSRQVNIPGYAIRLPRAMVLDLVQIGYLDMDGTPQICDPSVYRLNNVLEPGIVSLQFGQIWPIPLPEVNAVWIDYDCGWGSPFTLAGGSSPSTSLQVQGPVAFSTGQLVSVYNSGGALPDGLAPLTPYLVGTVDVTPVQISDPDQTLQARLAAAGQPPATITFYAGNYTLTDMRGNAITIGASAGGTNYIGPASGGPNFLSVVPDGVRSWIKIRMGSLYENREEVAILSRGQIKELPFIDGLLDPYRTALE